MGDSAASVGVLADGAELGAVTLNHHHAVTKAVHEAEDLPVVSENGKVDESSVESPQGAPARPASPPTTPPCSESMAPTAAPDTEAQTVTSSQTSHTTTSFESAVTVQDAGSEVQAAAQSQSVQSFSSQSQAIHSQSVQSATVVQSQTTTSVNGTHSIQSQNSSTTNGQESIVDVNQSQSAQSVIQSQSAQTLIQSEVASSAIDAPVDPPRLEHPSVDENANSIPEEVPAHPEPAAAPEPVVEQATTEAPEVQEQTAVPEPTPASEPAEAPEPAASPKPVVLQEPEVPPEPSVTPEETITQEPAAPPEPAAIQETVETQESAPPPEPEPAPIPQEPAAPEPQPVAQAPEAPPAASPEPVPAPQPEPTVEVEPVAAPKPEPPAEAVVSSSGGGRSAVEEISQEHIKEQLHEIITEIEQQVLPEQEQEQHQQEEVQRGGGGGGVAMRDTKPSEEAWPVVVEDGLSFHAEEVEYYDEDGVLHHTWKPKGKYQVPKTVIQYEDVVPISVPDVTFSLRAEPPKPAPPPPEPEPFQPEPQSTVVINQDSENLTNGAASPIEIPAGIPLLARILPKDNEDGEKKMISLERLFTPATDSGDLTPKRSPSKKAFASSSFYRPDHPTIDDQVELAQRISFSLVDENNKMSRGQSMYMKRKKRSMRWIHAGGEGGEGQEEEQTLKHPPAAQRPASVPADAQADTKKPPMKLLMSPKGVQDFHAVQEHYQALMEAIPTSPEVGKIMTEVQSPTGKGAELFAKRKKRMDKFIVDETTVQKASTTTSSTTRTQQQQSISSTTNDLALKKSAVEQRNRQQQEIMEQFLRSREQSLTLVKSPWQATMETGTPDAAFDDKRQKLKLANTVCERADTKLAQEASWLEPPKAVPLVAAPLSAEVTPTPAPLSTVVTGSTDGIGKEYAKELAKRGMNVVLISRTLDKLKRVAAEIAKEFGVETEIVQADFSNGRPIYERIAKHLQNKEIGVLVNNVGVLLSHPMLFGDATEEDIWAHVNVNVASVPAMTKLVLPGMLRRRRGAIVNLSSIASLDPVPFFGIYAATKAFVDFFSRSLEYEYRDSGITVQCLIPYYVTTGMTKYSDLVNTPGLFIPTPSTYASNAVQTLGCARKTTGYWPHGIQAHMFEHYVSSRLCMYMNYNWQLKLIRSMKKNQD